MNPSVPWEQRPLLKRLDWVNTTFLILTPILAAVLAPLYVYSHGFSLWVAIPFVLYCACTSTSITAGYHRFLAHKSYEAHPILKVYYLLFGAAAFQGSALQWATDHRRHHAFVDTDRDPYNINKGFFWAHIGWLFLREEPSKRPPFVPDLAKDPLIAFQHKYYGPIALIMGFGFPTLIGYFCGSALGGLIFGGFVRCVFTMHCTFCINSLAHTLGRRPYNDKQSARDSLLMAIIAYGEGYHNYHHHFASDYRNGIRWYHWDPTKWMIWAMSLVGFTHRLKCTPPTEIMKARLRIDEKRLLQFGASADRISALKTKVEEAQVRWRTLREDYKQLKLTMKAQSRETVLQLRAECRVAKLEFKMAWAQWSAYRRTMRAQPARLIVKY